MRGLGRLVCSFSLALLACSFSLAPNDRFAASPWRGAAAESMTLDQATEFAIGLYNQADAAEAGDGTSGDGESAADLRSRSLNILETVAAADRTYFPAAFFLGMIMQQLGDPGGAAAAYRQALEIDPRHSDSCNNLGKAYADLGERDLAVFWYNETLRIDPAHRQARLNLGVVANQAGEYEAAIAHISPVLQTNRVDDEANYNTAFAYERLGKVTSAVEHYRHALAGRRDYKEAWINLAALHHKHGALSDAIWHYEHALGLLDVEGTPADRGMAIMLHNNVGLALQATGAITDAMAHHHRALAILMQSIDGGGDGGDGGVEGDAAALWDTVVHTKSHLCKARAVVCDWEHFDSNFRELRRLIDDRQTSRGFHSALLPFDTLGAEVTPAWRKEVAVNHSNQWSSLQVERGRASPEWPRPPSLKSARGGVGGRGPIHVGYICYDFNDHPTTHLVEGLFKWHKASSSRDRGPSHGSKLSVTAFNYGKDDNSTYRAAVVHHVDSFVDLCEAGHAEAADRVRNFHGGPHILVDLQGHTLGGRPEITARRPAPIQVNYLIFPGTSGAWWVDYILCDRHVLPPDTAPAHYTEKLAYLPHSYQVNFYDRHVPGGGSHIAGGAGTISSSVVSAGSATRGSIEGINALRTANGLPLIRKNAPYPFVFCNFNKNDKLEPNMFGVWMAILRRVPGSVLWLLRPSQRMATESIEIHLRATAAALGVAPDRIRFAARVPKADHLVRHGAADLFLDTFKYGAHSTATDALRGGLPVLTCPGDSFARRVGLSLVSNLVREPGVGGNTARGHPVLQSLMMVHQTQDYEDMAVRMACGTDALHRGDGRGGREGALTAGLGLRRIRRDLWEMATSAVLFDTEGFTRDMERSFEVMWDLYAAGEDARHLVVGKTRERKGAGGGEDT